MWEEGERENRRQKVYQFVWHFAFQARKTKPKRRQRKKCELAKANGAKRDRNEKMSSSTKFTYIHRERGRGEREGGKEKQGSYEVVSAVQLYPVSLSSEGYRQICDKKNK